MKSLITTKANTWCFISSLILSGLFALGVNQLKAEYIYEANQDLFNLTNLTGTTNFNTGDDQLAGAFNLDFTFTLYGEDFTSARMATNGCLHFGLGTGNVNYNNYCGDYTPDPLPHTTYTLYPFWTDLIRDNGSKMLAKNFTDKSVFGWYNMKEYGRNNTDNSFEVILWTNDTFEYRYGGLNITNHDVLIGEQGSATETYTYLFHDECSTGTTNVAGTCVNTNFNNTSFNTLLENGGSLYGEGSGNAVDCSDPLNSSSCSGYAAAYLAQQCGLDSLHSTSCPLYWEAYDDQQCDEDPQYAPFCAGYTQEASVAYYIEEEFDYGYEEETNYEDYYIEEWFEEPFEEFNYISYETEYDEIQIMFGEDIFSWEDEEIIFEEYSIGDVDPLPDFNIIEEEYVIFERIDEPLAVLDIIRTDELIDIFEFETIIREELENEEERIEEFESIEDLEEWFEETMDEIQEADEIIEITESREELLAETEENTEEEIESENEIEEVFAENEEEVGEQRSSVRISALDVVAGTMQTARNSYSSSASSVGGNSSIYSGGSSGGSNVSTVTSSSSGASMSSTGGVSTTSSPSLSDQFASASAQTQQILSMSSDTGTSGGTTITINVLPDVDGTPQVAMADVQVQDMQGEIDTAVSGVMTASEADQIAEQIVAQNIEAQQEQAETEQQETGEYGDQSTLVAYLGYVVGFDAYREIQLPTQDTWYEPRAIYADSVMSDNTQAFYQLAKVNLNSLGDMINLQPEL
jgi:hypothetical protein